MSWDSGAIDRRIEGRCPMCGKDSLFIAAGGYVTCAFIECPNPTGLSDIIGDTEIEHVVLFEPYRRGHRAGFVIRHPLRERLNNALMTCALGVYIAGMDHTRVAAGKYRVSPGPGRHTWRWETLDALGEIVWVAGEKEGG